MCRPTLGNESFASRRRVASQRTSSTSGSHLGRTQDGEPTTHANVGGAPRAQDNSDDKGLQQRQHTESTLRGEASDLALDLATDPRNAASVLDA